MTMFMTRALRAPLAGLSLAVTLGALAALPGPASAHATLEESTAAANSTYKAVMRIGHGCDGAATDRLVVELPDGMIAAKPMPKPGWALATETGAYDKTYDYYGTPMTEGVRRIIWSGGSLPDAFYDEFVVRARVTDLPDGTALPIRVIQGCGDARVAWTEIAAPGQDPHDLPHPALVLTVTQASGGGHHTQAAAAPAPSTVTVGPITVSKVFARATPGPVRTGAAYLQLRNTGDSPLALTQIRGTVAERIELHEMTMENGTHKMRQIDHLMIPAGGTVSLRPGAHHVMLIGLAAPLVEGESFPLTLHFDTGLEMTVTVPIGPVGAMSPHSHH